MMVRSEKSFTSCREALFAEFIFLWIYISQSTLLILVGVTKSKYISLGINKIKQISLFLAGLFRAFNMLMHYGSLQVNNVVCSRYQTYLKENPFIFSQIILQDQYLAGKKIGEIFEYWWHQLINVGLSAWDCFCDLGSRTMRLLPHL